jgi:hypothetical protein
MGGIMLKKHNISLNSADISGLWKAYIQNTATLCIVKHFIQHVQDSEIKPIINEQINLLETYIDKTKNIFIEEDFPIPKGFSEDDVDLSAPALYTDLYALSFIYRFNQMTVSDYASTLPKVVRTDVVDFFDDCLKTSTNLYKKALNLMQTKGIYDRQPKVSYPQKVEFIKKQESIIGSLFGEHRPLNVMELGEIFYLIERNYIGMLLLMGFIQVMKDKEIKEYLLKGKELSQKQIDIFNKVLKEEQHLGNIPVSMEVTDSVTSPFSDRLITFLIATTSSTGIFLTAYSIANSMRKDLVAKYSLIMAEIMKYGEEGMKLLIDRGWMEQPPQSFDRNAIFKT